MIKAQPTGTVISRRLKTTTTRGRRYSRFACLCETRVSSALPARAGLQAVAANANRPRQPGPTHASSVGACSSADLLAAPTAEQEESPSRHNHSGCPSFPSASMKDGRFVFGLGPAHTNNFKKLAITGLHHKGLDVTRSVLGLGWLGAGIMEADDRQVTTDFTVQPSFHHQHSTNRVCIMKRYHRRRKCSHT